MKNLIQRFIREESGQDLIEYALLAALIAVVLVARHELVTGGIVGVFTRVAAALAPRSAARVFEALVSFGCSASQGKKRLPGVLATSRW